MADWKLGPDGKTLIYVGAGAVPLLTGAQQVAMRGQLANAPSAPPPAPPHITATPPPQAAPRPPSGGGMVAAVPSQVIQQGIPKPPTQVPAQQPVGGLGNQQYFAKGGTLVPGVTLVNGMPTANDTSFAGPNDTIVQRPDGTKTVLMANGLSVHIPAAAEAPEAPAHAGFGGGGGLPPPATNNPATKVIGPQTAKDLLPAFSPPAINQFPSFYDPGAYRPVEGSSNIGKHYKGKTNPDIGNQSELARILGVPWSAESMTLREGHNGYGMPKGGDLTNNWVDPRVYGYIAPTLNQALYHGARVEGK